jgi:hypothetical protein
MRWLCLLSLAVPSIAFADVLMPPPAACPEGSTGVDCHGPETCETDACERDNDCGEGQVCRPRMLCVRDNCCNGRGCGTTPYEIEHVAGPCGTGGACEEFGTSCQSRDVCVDAPAGTDAGRTDAGRTEDAGRAQDAGRREDAGRADDAGRTGNDAGRDAGTGGEVEGGCCSSTGARNELGGALFLALVVAFVVRFARKSRHAP